TQTVTDTAIAGTPVYTYTYDALNRPDITTISNYPGGNKTLNNDYNRFGHRNTLTFTDSSGSVTHQYTYNKLGQLSSATLPGTQTFTGFEYFANNQLKHITAPGGINLDYTYETNGPVKTIGYTNGAVSLDNLSYTYDATRNVDTLTNTNGLHDYNYDNLYRLTGATHPVSSGLPTAESFTYDDAGNRENPADLAAYDYDNNNRITTSPGVTSYGFDADGNTTSKTGGEIFGYNHNNQLTSYSKTGTTASYVYDAAARRINKTVNGTATWYLWDGSKLLAEYNSSGTRTKRYAYLPNNFAPVQMADSTGTYNVLSNHLQTPILLTNSSNQIVWRANYEAFGKATINDDVDGNGARITFNVRMPRQYYDVESNLNYNHHRYYSTELGRYITSDPIGLLGGMNTYSYAENNPINWIDPYGLVDLAVIPIRSELTTHFPTELSNQEVKDVASFMADQVGWGDLNALRKKDPEAIKALEDRVREALKDADADTQKLFEWLDALKKAYEEAEKDKKECEGK
ncbi:MAG: hypothetical protein HYZ31_07005, partial [Gammaproteobacteria bacterium]|nr:hypothetical protein [Gammaproteobacteria bacterium]